MSRLPRAAAAPSPDESLARQVAGLTRLHRLTERLFETNDEALALGEILDSLLAIHETDRGLLSLFEPETGALRVAASASFSEPTLARVARVEPGCGACGIAFEQNRRIVVEDVEIDPVFAPYRDLAREAGFRAVHSTPIRNRAGACLGVLSVHFPTPRRPSELEMRLADMHARQAGDFLERARAHAALRESQERFRQVAEVAPQLIWVHRGDGALEYVNRRWIDYTGLDVADISDRERLRLVFHADDHTELFRRWRRSLATGDVFEMETRVRGAAAGFRWFLVRTVPLRDEAGRVVRWFGAFTDIHARKQQEADARFLVELGELTRASDPDELVGAVAGLVERHLEVSRCAFTEIFAHEDRWIVRTGRQRTEMGSPLSAYPAELLAPLRVGRPVSIADTATDPRTAALERELFRPLGGRAFAVVPLLRGGAWVWCLNVVSETPRAWEPRELALLETAAERTWTALEKLRLDAELRTSEERYRSLTRVLASVVWQADEEGALVGEQAEWAAYTGQGREEYRAGGWIRAVHPEDRERVREDWARALRERGRYETDHRLWNAPRAEYRYVVSRAVPLLDAEGGVREWIGTITDVHEQRQAEEALREADRRKDEFLAMLAHELRNPLAPIHNAAQVLKLVAGSEDPTQAWARDVIERQAQHLSRLVDDLLDVSRITRGKIALAREPLDVAAIVRLAAETSQPLIETRRHALSLDLWPGPLWVEGDLTRLVQVVGNLLNNAAKYTDEGGHIGVQTAEADGWAVIRVRDDGMGLAPELLSRVFDLFTQADRSLDRSQGGLGIGLTLVRLLVEMHGGRVEARSEGPGKGSEFEVRLPIKPAARAARAAERPARERAAPMRVLVVEDHADSADMMRFVLELAGHDVRAVADGHAALETARAFDPDLVLCDIGLPGMDGYEVAARMRADPALKRARLVAVSGYGQDEDRRRSRDAGFDEHLTKPVHPDALEALLCAVSRAVARV